MCSLRSGVLPTRYLLQVSKYPSNVNLLRTTATVATQDQVKSIEEMPGPLCLPFLGSTWQFLPLIGKFRFDILHLDRVAEVYYEKYGSMVYEKFGNIKVVHMYEPEHFEVVAKATLNKPQRMGFLALSHYRDSNPEKYNSPGILPVNDERWWKLRQMFQKSVSPLKEARDLLGPTDDITKEFIHSFKSGDIIEDFMPLSNRLNMELVCQMLFDERIYCFNKEALAPDSYWTHFIQEVVEFAEGIGEQDRNHIMWKIFKGNSYKKMEKMLHRMEEFAMKMIEKVKARGDDDSKCIIAQFLRDPNIPDKELLAITLDLLLGGIHTTAITTCFLLYHVSQNPEVQRKLKEESKRLLPPGASITTSTLNEAVYTRAVVKEIFRLTPIATAQGRILPEDLVVGGYNIPKQTLIILQSLAVCRQERFFKDALKFKPERWIKGSPEYQQVSPYLSMPFGLGLRSCIARRRAEQNLHVFTLRMYGSGEMEWMRDDELGFTTPFMISPEGDVKFKFHRHS